MPQGLLCFSVGYAVYVFEALGCKSCVRDSGNGEELGEGCYLEEERHRPL